MGILKVLQSNRTTFVCGVIPDACYKEEIVFQSEWSVHGIRYLSLLCQPLVFRRLNPDWTKCGQISLFVSATRKNFDSRHQDLDIEDPISCVQNFQ